MDTFTFYSNFTWRTAGFYLFSNSLAYRNLLEENTEWDITYHPPPGSVLRSPTKGGRSSSSGLAARSINTDFGYTSDASTSYYPYDNDGDYARSLARYNVLALYDIEACNGLSATSEIVDSGDYTGTARYTG